MPLLKKYTYFGVVEVYQKSDPAENMEEKRPRVVVRDNFSATTSEFELPIVADDGDQIVSSIDYTEDGPMVFFLLAPTLSTRSNAKTSPARENTSCSLFAFDVRFEKLFRLEISRDVNFSAPAEMEEKGEGGNNASQCFPRSIHWTECPDFVVSTKKSMEEITTSWLLEKQFAHWREFREAMELSKFSEIDEEGNCVLIERDGENQNAFMLACTAFAAFLVVNFGSHSSSTIIKIFDAREGLQLKTLEKTGASAISLPPKNSPPIPWSWFRLEVPIKKICAGKDHLVILGANGVVYTVGSGNHGELGHGVLASDWSGPRPIQAFVDEGIEVVDVCAGSWHSVALTRSSDVYAWGWNSVGQLGISPEEELGAIIVQPFPHPIDFNLDFDTDDPDDGESSELRIFANHNKTAVALVVPVAEDERSEKEEKDNKSSKRFTVKNFVEFGKNN